MESWFVLPESDRLPLSSDHWVLVRRRLNTGEHRAHLRRSSREHADGTRRLDALEHGLSLVVAYLLDWSLKDIPIQEMGRPLEPDALVSVIDNLDFDRFVEIRKAIEAHVEKQDAAREVEKKTAGRKTSDPISALPSNVDAPSSTSVN